MKSQSTPTPQLAEMAFAGGFLFNIPAQSPPQETSFSAGCTADQTFNIFAVWPHQHQIGTHNKFEIIRNQVPTVLHDDNFDFNEQKYYRQTPEFVVQPGDQIKVTCTWLNDTGADIHFGDSTTDEMCFDGLYRYPAQGTNIFKCTDTQGAGF